MYLGYFVNNRFPFPQGRSDGPFKTFPGSPRSPCGMGFYRPNQAMSQVYTTRPQLNGLGDVTVNTPLLIGGIAALAAAMFLFGGKAGPKLRKRKAARLRKTHKALGARIKQLEA